MVVATRLPVDLRDEQPAPDGLRQEIYVLLYDERTGLPASKYDDEEFHGKTDILFQYFMHNFRPPPIQDFRWPINDDPARQGRSQTRATSSCL